MRMFVYDIISIDVRETVGGTHRLQVAMYDLHRMQILESACCLCKLRGDIRILGLREGMEIGHTRRRRLTSGCFEAKSMMFPSTIHSVMTHSGNSFGDTPNTGRTFGWESRLQITIS